VPVNGPLLVDQLRFMAEAHADENAYEDLDAREAITFQQWDERSNRVARWLAARGVGKGDRVSVYLPSEYCLQWIVAYAGIHKAGAVCVPTNTRLSERELAAIIGHAEISAMVTGAPMLGNVEAVRAGIPSLTAILSPDAVGDGGSRKDIEPWSVLDEFDASETQVPLSRDDLADIMYTSGTTGLPKGVVVRHRDVAMMPNGDPNWLGTGWLHGAPLFTFAGMSFIFNPMKMGLCALYMPKFDVDHWFDVVEQRRPMMVFMVPAMAELVTASPRFETADLSGPFAVSIGSAPLAPPTLLKLQDKMPQSTVSNSYGLTEAGPAFITMPKEEIRHRLGSVGKPMPPMEVQIVDPETNALCAPNVVGELLCRLPGKQREYYKDDDATTKTWTTDGWLRSGDLAYTDDDGFIYISGRMKDMIIRGGNNIYATDVEAVIIEHPAVQEAAVIGVPHTVLGEDVGAFVVLKQGAALSDDDLKAFCAERLADYKRPRVVRFVTELPRNATGKVMKHKLRGEFGAPGA
jgi:acyl-CoA synthetase (AMP-forming)/AMP-acid ligase II